MALSKRKIAAIQVEYCSGIVTLAKLAKKHKIAVRTITRLAKKNGWKRVERPGNVHMDILKKAEEKFIEKESDRLARFTEAHIGDMGAVRQVTRANLADVVAAVRDAKKENASLHKDVSENFFALQKVCKIASETLTNCYREERLAMGLDNIKTKQIQFVGEISEKDAEKVKELFDGITE